MFAKDNASRLLKARKLALVLDIDMTLLHATNDARAPAFARKRGAKVYPFQLPGDPGYHYVKLRPGLAEFLRECHTRYTLYIYTHGVRSYAEKIVEIIDPTNELFAGAQGVLLQRLLQYPHGCGSSCGIDRGVGVL